MMLNEVTGPSAAARWGRWLGPLLFLLVVALPTGGLDGDAELVAGVALWMAVWWVSEAVPLAATALIPIVLFPVLGVQSVKDVTPNYANHMVFLFFGGFVLALAVEASNLHERAALTVLSRVGSSPRRLIWGFLVVTAGLSMWLSNTATTLMLLPIAAGVAARINDAGAGSRLFLAVAYGASVGGMATLVGTPPNLVLAGMAPELLPGLPAISFGGWMLFGLPVVIVLIPILGLRLGRGLSEETGGAGAIESALRALGAMTTHEKRAALLFAATAAAWITRPGFDFGVLHLPGWGALLPAGAVVSDAVPAVAAAILATLLPAGNGNGRRMLTWVEVHDGVPWGILLLFGGGFALADAVRTSGLDDWLAELLGGLAGLPLPLVILTICLVATFTTELTSNTATATLLMPVMAALSGVLDVPPYLLMVAATLSCSCAFMLPVATPPNAIVMGSGRVTTRVMAREGLWLNLVIAVVLTVMVLTWGRFVLPV